MSQNNGSNGKTFTAVELTPRWSVKINHTPNQGRDYFTLSYCDENRKRQRQLYRDLSTAQAEAEKLRRKMDKGLMPGLLLTGRERLIYERAVEAARPTGLDLDVLTTSTAEARAILGTVAMADAARLYVDHKLKIVPKTVSDVVQELVADRTKNGKSATYIRDLRRRLGNFAKAFSCPIASVEWKDIEKYLDGTGASGRYRKNLIDGIGTLFNFARRRNYVHRDHPGTSPITKPAPVPREIRVFTPEECQKLLLGLPPRVVPAAAIG